MARSNRRRRATSRSRNWRRVDLHIHTPRSADYQEPGLSFLDILRQAEARGLDIIAFTDHNTVAGYAAMVEEIEQLSYLERLNRLKLDERQKLESYRRLLDSMLVLPGFEFTATFGFHILGIFAPDTQVSYLEHILLTLNVPLEQLEIGGSTVGATSDVLTAYRLINESGGLVIAAHANSGNGVVMRGLDFGGQTRIAYTQDKNLHCLEVTDLDRRGRYTTRRFFDGSKPEYPRAMRCIQGSDAHRLFREGSSSKNLGVGDRVTEILLEEISFDALASVLKGSDFSLTRPFRGPASPQDFVLIAREEGPSIVQSFHKSMAQRGGHMNRILEDVCAMANTNGGTIYVGVPPSSEEKVIGVREPGKAIDFLQSTISKRLSPVPDVTVDSLVSQGQTIVRIAVRPGTDIPYAIDDNRIYVRDETETTIAVRDEIVRLVEKRMTTEGAELPVPPTMESQPVEPLAAPAAVREQTAVPPSTGVEIVSSVEREGTIYHTVRDLRNNNLIKNVTRSSARKLWHYAITKAEAGVPRADSIRWHGNIALLAERRRDGYVWYDLAMKDEAGVHYYYGVTDSGLNEDWMELVEKAGGGV